MTVRKVIDAALAEVGRFFDAETSPESIWIARISTRQEELFERASKVNSNYHGVCATGTLDANGAIDLEDMDGVGSNPPAPDQVQRVEIADKGTSSLTNGQRVNIVDIDDPDASIAPRATLRDHVLRQVGTELDGVVSVTVYYARRPLPLTADTESVDLRGSHAYLLVWDLAVYMARRAPHVDEAQRQTAIKSFRDEEGPALERFDRHVAAFDAVLQTRFE